MLDNEEPKSRPLNNTEGGESLETGASVLGLRKEGIKVSAVFMNMVVIGFGFMQFGKLE